MSESTASPLTDLLAAIGAKYRIEREIGTGGMATVYVAEDARHARRVAIKVLRPELASTIGAERFLREIAIAARLQHPNILGLLDSGAANGNLYYVMPFVDGVSLRTRLAQEGELPLEEGVRLLCEILDALAYAHAQGIVHRDIKPENVMLAGYARSGSSRAHALVADFGVAKAITDSTRASAITATGLAVGTPAYMAPEQATADPNVDHRADIYALGVLAYEMFAGVPPFSAATAQHLIAAHMTRTPEPIATHRASIPAEVDAIVMRALAKRPADRWQTADEMLSRLEALRTPSAGLAITRAARAELAERSFLLTDDVCRRLDRQTLDPSIIGDEMRFLDNQVASDVLVYFIHGTGQDHGVFRELFVELPYRCVAPTLLGFEPARRSRPAISVDNHIGIIREHLRATIDDRVPATVILVGFSSGADVALRMAADSGSELPRVNALISLGCNLSFETCFVTRLFMQLGSNDESGLLEELRRFGTGSQTLEEWLKVHEYLVGTFRKFGHEVAPVRRFSEDIVRRFEQQPDTFSEVYRLAAGRVSVVRCLWEDAPSCIQLVQRLRLRNLDDPSLLGAGYRSDSLVIESRTDHFDLIEPRVLRPHLDAVIAASKKRTTTFSGPTWR